MTTCFVCGAEAAHDHHVVPRSVLPNDATIPLCDRCHSLVPGHPESLIRGQSLSWYAREVKRRACGRQVGGHPRFGFKWQNGDVVPDPSEQEQMKTISELHEAGFTDAEIAEWLTEAGFVQRNGSHWNAHKVSKRRIAMGLYRRGPYGAREAA